MNEDKEQYQDLEDENHEEHESPIEPEILSNDPLPVSAPNKAKRQGSLVGYSYKGPLPPKLLEEYDKFRPGFSSEYLTSIIEEPKHRRRIETQELELLKNQSEQNALFLQRQSRRSDRGLLAGVVSVVLVLALCAYMVSQKATSEAAWTAGTILPSLAGVFVIGTLKNKKEEENNKDLEIGEGTDKL
jgi:uncharacterized membrane protein